MLSVAIIGRPNVGKSTLFNRMAGRRLALVDATPGLTRDRRETEIILGRREIRLIDTAGLEEAQSGTIAARMRAQTEAAIHAADAILFVLDARAGVTPADEAFGELVRASGKPVILAANKSEGRSGEAGYYESFQLGFGEAVPISAEHGEGMPELYRQIDAALSAQGDGAAAGESAPQDESEDEAPQERTIRMAVVGRPNAGKSTLVNMLLGEERMITGPEPGLTRDAIAADLTWQGKKIKLFDTAGLRRKARVTAGAERLAVSDALRAIRFAEVVVLLVDVLQPLEKQDLQIADMVAAEGRALVIAVNKWDLVQAKQTRLAELKEAVDSHLPQIKGVPLVTLSALRGQGIGKLMTAAFSACEIWNRRVATGALNRWFEAALARHTPPAVQGKRIKLRFITQPNARPPTFVIFSSRPEALPQAYVRYLINGLREAFDLWGVPIRLNLRKGKNPYVAQARAGAAKP